MSNRRLTDDEREHGKRIVAEVRQRLREFAGGSYTLEWALRRYVHNRLIFDERGTPIERQALKRKLRERQGNKCARCGDTLLERGNVLDRMEAMWGYIPSNTRLLCYACDWAK